MIYNLIETATGRNISQSSIPIPSPKDGYHVVETADNVGVWNESTLVFDPYPSPRIISTELFIERFTATEQEDIIDAAKTSKKANRFIQILKLVQAANLDSEFIQVSVNAMESAGVIGVGRAAEVLA